MKHILCFLLMLGLLVHSAEWQQAPQGHVLTFPKDHGSHAGQKIEWWYFTGNLIDSSNHAFGYQLTFFRIGTDPKPENPSTWTVRDLHMAHFAISDVSGGKYYCAQRLGRSGPGLAGALEDRLRAWNGTWTAEMTGENQIKLSATAEDGKVPFGLQLDMNSTRPIVAHGEGGYSRKGQQPGNASIYYSFTRLKSQGAITLGKERFDVTGLSWMDHEFGTSFLEPGQIGWDWFSLQLDDGSDLMLFQIRQLNSAVPPSMSGTLVSPQGQVTNLRPGDFKLESSDPWKSPVTTAAYPLKWNISVPTANLTLTTTTKLKEQEMHSPKAGPSYWEGAIEATGTLDGKPINGRGYLEMTGYAGASMRSFFHGPE